MGRKLGLTVENIKETIETQRKTVLEHLSGMMAICTKDNGEMISKMEKACTSM